MACDSLYAAWLKVHYPFELYLSMLKLYDEKHNRDKIAAIISEMKRYKDIQLTVGRFGQDNRDWLVDKKLNTISQSISSVSYMSRLAAKELYEVGKKKFEYFTDVLRELQMNTCLNTRQIFILIELNYFSQFGKSGKLMKVYDNFFNGEKKLTKTVKSFESRLELSREYERSLEDEDLSICQRLYSEFSNVGLCISADKSLPSNLYFVQELDTKYGVKTKMYSAQRGTTGIIRIRKDTFSKHPFEEGDCFKLVKYNTSPKYTYQNKKKVALPGEKDIWAEEYEVIKAPSIQKGD
jgi:DNA polymerase III alpha subunit